MAQRSITDQLFTLKIIQNNSYERDLVLHMLFMNFKQANDSILGAKLHQALFKLGIGKKLINMAKITLTTTINRFVVGGNLTNQFVVERELPTDLFNLVFQAMTRRSKINTNYWENSSS